MAVPAAPTVTTFRGFPPDALEFFVELEANNERAWWLANKSRFDEVVRDPMRALLDRLDESFGRFHVFRMNRDVRFSNDKSPYKTAHGAVAETEGGSYHYVEISGTGLRLGVGMYHPATDQLNRLRASIAGEATGAALERALATVRKAGLDVTGGGHPPLSTAPRGFARDHPRIELLRWKGCTALTDVGAPAWLHTARIADHVAKIWAKAHPLLDWLDANVGPSELPPDD